MEKNKTIFDYIGMIFTIYGFTVASLVVLCVLFGEDAKEVSSIFALGSEGLSWETMMQFFLTAVLIASLRYLFFTERIIKKASLLVRTIGLFVTVILLMVAFAILFGWFPTNQWLPWVMFVICFGISTGVSVAVSVVKERHENKRMEEALRRLKEAQS